MCPAFLATGLSTNEQISPDRYVNAGPNVIEGQISLKYHRAYRSQSAVLEAPPQQASAEAPASSFLYELRWLFMPCTGVNPIEPALMMCS